MRAKEIRASGSAEAQVPGLRRLKQALSGGPCDGRRFDPEVPHHQNRFEIVVDRQDIEACNDRSVLR